MITDAAPIVTGRIGKPQPVAARDIAGAVLQADRGGDRGRLRRLPLHHFGR